MRLLSAWPRGSRSNGLPRLGLRSNLRNRLCPLRPPARKRRAPERLALIEAARHADPARALRAMLSVAPVELAVFARDRGLADATARQALDDAQGHAVGAMALSQAQLESLRDGMQAQLSQFHGSRRQLPKIYARRR